MLALNPPSLAPPLAAYSHGILAPPGGRILFTSGQLGMAGNGEIPEDVGAQATICFENISAILRAGELGFDDVVKFTAYVTDRSYFPIYGAVRARYAPKGAYASTLLIVGGFTLPAFKIEVEAIAIGRA